MWWLVGLVAIAACSKAQPQPEPQPTPPAVATTRWYRALIGEKQGVAVPFFLEIPDDGDAVIVNGPDRVRAHVQTRPPQLAIVFEMFHTKILATGALDGSLDGTWASTSKSWGVASLSFHATPIVGPDPALRFPSSPGPDPTGTWKLQLTKPGELAKLVLVRGTGDELSGTLAFQTGNLAFVAGNQQGTTVRLSAFEGQSPYLVVATLDVTGTKLTGSWVAGQALDWKETLVGTKTGGFALALPTKLAHPNSKLSRDELTREPYRGHPVIVELGGSWCPACGHAVTELRDLIAKYPDLRVLTLAYEFTDDHRYNAEQAAAFKAKYNVPWEVVAVDGGLDKYNEILPPELDAVDASGFPIAIFIHRDRTIEAFHSGFPSETWGPLHHEAIAAYDNLAAKIVAK